MTALVTCLSIKTRQKKTGPTSDIRNTRSKLKNSVTHWCKLKTNTFLREVTALRFLVGLARAVRRQSGNTVLGGFNNRPLEKITAFRVLSVWCSTKRGNRTQCIGLRRYK